VIVTRKVVLNKSQSHHFFEINEKKDVSRIQVIED